jgi:hypothetical protein
VRVDTERVGGVVTPTSVKLPPASAAVAAKKSVAADLVEVYDYYAANQIQFRDDDDFVNNDDENLVRLCCILLFLISVNFAAMLLI